VGCLGRIIRDERLPDGRFHLLLLGLRRVRIDREVAQQKLYRTARVQILDEIASAQPESPVREELVGLFRRLFRGDQQLDPDFAELLEKPVPLGVLTDLLAHALALPPAVKQRLLAEPCVDRRAEALRLGLRQTAPARPPGRPFPPLFSDN
jgi:Lon protease-like protein